MIEIICNLYNKLLFFIRCHITILYMNLKYVKKEGDYMLNNNSKIIITRRNFMINNKYSIKEINEGVGNIRNILLILDFLLKILFNLKGNFSIITININSLQNSFNTSILILFIVLIICLSIFFITYLFLKFKYLKSKSRN